MTLITSVLPLGRLRSMVVAVAAATPVTSEPEPEEFSALAIGAAMAVANTTALAMRNRCLGRGEVVIVISVPCQRCNSSSDARRRASGRQGSLGMVVATPSAGRHGARTHGLW